MDPRNRCHQELLDGTTCLVHRSPLAATTKGKPEHTSCETLRKPGFQGKLDGCHLRPQGKLKTLQLLKKNILRSTTCTGWGRHAGAHWEGATWDSSVLWFFSGMMEPGTGREDEPCHSSYSELPLQDLRILATKLKGQRKKMYWHPHSCKNTSTSRARTGRHNPKHPGQTGWGLRVCRSECIWSLMDLMREELSSLINSQT